MTDKFNFGSFLKNNTQIQELVQKAQDELKKIRITGESGAGMVKVIITAQHEAVDIKISDELFTEIREAADSEAASKKEMLEDLIKGAFNNATQKVSSIVQEKMMNATGLLSEIGGDESEGA